jgi:CheY-like chemotaxis protein
MTEGLAGPVGRRRILVVDDSADTSRVLSRVIGMLGHEVRTATNGTEAVGAASVFLPDVVLMDVGLPGIDGYEAARRIRDRPWGAGITLIALTAYGRGIDGGRFNEAGFDHHLDRPVGLDARIGLIGRPLPPRS